MVKTWVEGESGLEGVDRGPKGTYEIFSTVKIKKKNKQKLVNITFLFSSSSIFLLLLVQSCGNNSK